MQAAIHPGTELSELARQRWRKFEHRPLLVRDWLEAVFIHYEIDARILQRAVPFPLEQREGRA
jgi:hypothetical protein